MPDAGGARRPGKMAGTRTGRARPGRAERPRLAAGAARDDGALACSGRHGDRIPANYEPDRAARPDAEILREGLEVIGRFEFAVGSRWTADSIAGYLASTSVLSPVALGDSASGFDQDLRGELHAAEPGGEFRQESAFAYDLARRRPA